MITGLRTARLVQVILFITSNTAITKQGYREINIISVVALLRLPDQRWGLGPGWHIPTYFQGRQAALFIKFKLISKLNIATSGLRKKLSRSKNRFCYMYYGMLIMIMIWKTIKLSPEPGFSICLKYSIRS